MPLGPVMLDVAGLELTSEDKQRLLHPHVGAVILFARNFSDKQQVSKLIQEIKQLRTPSLLIAVDQEGGRVQRFKKEFTILPPVSEFGQLWDKDKQTAPMRAFDSAYTMASQLIEVGVDFSFAPVLDVGIVKSDVIGDRSFHNNPQVVAELAGAYIDGMHAAGMIAVGKHFPGHGGVSEDSHLCQPTDCRELQQVEECDLLPYQGLINEMQGIMSAHILYDSIDKDIATFSSFWIQTILREKLGFDGIVFSDDLSMEGAKQGSVVECAQRALYAGCDMVLVCNKPEMADELLEGLEYEPNERLSVRLNGLKSLS